MASVKATSERAEMGLAVAGLAALVLLALAGMVVGKLTWVALLVVLLLAAGIALGRLAPVYALAVLLASITVERADLTLLANGTIHVRLDEIVGPAIAVGLVLRARATVAPSALLARLRSIPGLLPLTLFLVENVVVTLATAFTISRGNLGRGMEQIILLVAGALCYVAVCLLAHELRRASTLTTLVVLTGAVEAMIGLIALVLSLRLKQPLLFGVQVDPITHFVEPYGTTYEANFFGQYMAAVAIVAMALLLGLVVRGQLRSRAALGLVVASGLAVVGVIVSLSRAAYASLALGMVVMVAVLGIVAWRGRGAAHAARQVAGSAAVPPSEGTRGGKATSVQPAWVALGVMLIGLVLAATGGDPWSAIGQTWQALVSPTPAAVSQATSSPTATATVAPGTTPTPVATATPAPTPPVTKGNDPFQRLATILDFGHGSALGRAEVLTAVLEDWRRSPIVGLGDNSYGQYFGAQTGTGGGVTGYTGGQTVYSGGLTVYAGGQTVPWITSMLVEILHDTGLLGLGLFLWFLVAVYLGLWRALRNPALGASGALVAGVTGAVTCLLVAAQSTNSTPLMLLWVFMGLAGAMPALVTQLGSGATPLDLMPTQPMGAVRALPVDERPTIRTGAARQAPIESLPTRRLGPLRPRRSGGP